MRRSARLIIGPWLLLLSLAAQTQTLKVVTSIKPVHSLVAAVMAGVADPYLIMRTNTSPHDYSLKPSDATALERAQLVFWMGAGLETFLSGPLRSLATRARTIKLLNTPGLQHFKTRELLIQDKDSPQAEIAPGRGDLDQDPHVWLDPDNARQMVTYISQVLAQSDPANAPLYRRNARQLDQRLDRLSGEIDQLLAPVREQPYIVYHDAYQYFERRFDLKPAAAITLNPELPAGAGRIVKIQNLVRRRQIRCVFTEPQFRPRLIGLLMEIPGVRSAVLDPLGAGIRSGPGLYEDMMRNNAMTIKNCLSG